MTEYEKVVEIEDFAKKPPSLSLRSFSTISSRIARLAWGDTVLMRREDKVNIDRFATITYRLSIAFSRQLRE